MFKHKNYDGLIGKKFGRLTVLKIIYEKQSKCLCQCECGNQIICLVTNLNNGNTKSCGCINKERIAAQGRASATHHLSEDPIYRKWIYIRKRCNNPNASDYENYGGRGIKMCQEWENDFMAFYKYVKPMFKENLQIDRIDNDKGYEPGNIRFVDAKTNNSNRRTTIKYKDGTLYDYCRENGLNYFLVWGRIKRGWNIDRAINEPVDMRYSHRKKASV